MARGPGLDPVPALVSSAQEVDCGGVTRGPRATAAGSVAGSRPHTAAQGHPELPPSESAVPPLCSRPLMLRTRLAPSFVAGRMPEPRGSSPAWVVVYHPAGRVRRVLVGP